MSAKPYGSKGRFDRIGGAQVRPVLGRKVVKSEQPFLVFFQALGRFWILRSVTLDELLVSCQSRFAGRRQVHFMDQLLSLALNTFGHFIEDIGRLMHPAPLLGYWAIFFLQGDPESKNRRRWLASVRW